ncbi:hypothetical protein HYH02_008166 [Chlamydomonas schloesseri]|uniref:RING-type domain-containing protein n=1 Tax=Chlamydomonas schloesseri TaxID=2026947 RepID=A0A835WGD6_9CHLO|nr:hypothetical protein HYH02_008166 [Chlamydomonas schloesseri]|eukprot:KAG2447013.1 hypothetical protein HYH02_008166 [Chlamydomonas schloesseri]
MSGDASAQTAPAPNFAPTSPAARRAPGFCIACSRRHAFFIAIEEGDAECVSRFLDDDPNWLRQNDKNPSYDRGRNGWHLAASKGQVEVLRVLVERARRGDVADSLRRGGGRHGSISMRLAAGLRPAAGPDEVLRELLNGRSARGVSPLMLAASHDRADAVAYLLSVGADPWLADYEGRCAVHYAARAGAVRGLTALLGPDQPHPPPGRGAGERNGVNSRYVDALDVYGWTPLHYATWANRRPAMAVLIGFDANIIARSAILHNDLYNLPPGATPLHIACLLGCLERVKLLLRAYYETAADLLPSQTAMLATAERRRRARSHPDPRLILTRTQRLPFHIAARCGHRPLLDYLDPSIPLMFLFGGEEEDSGPGGGGGAGGGGATGGGGGVALVGVSRLTVIAARALHVALLASLDTAAGDMQAAEAEAEAAREGRRRRRELRQAAREAAAAAAAHKAGKEPPPEGLKGTLRRLMERGGGGGDKAGQGFAPAGGSLARGSEAGASVGGGGGGGGGHGWRPWRGRSRRAKRRIVPVDDTGAAATAGSGRGPTAAAAGAATGVAAAADGASADRGAVGAADVMPSGAAEALAAAGLPPIGADGDGDGANDNPDADAADGANSDTDTESAADAAADADADAVGGYANENPGLTRTMLRRLYRVALGRRGSVGGVGTAAAAGGPSGGGGGGSRTLSGARAGSGPKPRDAQHHSRRLAAARLSRAGITIPQGPEESVAFFSPGREPGYNAQMPSQILLPALLASSRWTAAGAAAGPAPAGGLGAGGRDSPDTPATGSHDSGGGGAGAGDAGGLVATPGGAHRWSNSGVLRISVNGQPPSACATPLGPRPQQPPLSSRPSWNTASALPLPNFDRSSLDSIGQPPGRVSNPGVGGGAGLPAVPEQAEGGSERTSPAGAGAAATAADAAAAAVAGQGSHQFLTSMLGRTDSGSGAEDGGSGGGGGHRSRRQLPPLQLSSPLGGAGAGAGPSRLRHGSITSAAPSPGLHVPDPGTPTKHAPTAADPHHQEQTAAAAAAALVNSGAGIAAAAAIVYTPTHGHGSGSGGRGGGGGAARALLPGAAVGSSADTTSPFATMAAAAADSDSAAPPEPAAETVAVGEVGVAPAASQLQQQPSWGLASLGHGARNLLQSLRNTIARRGGGGGGGAAGGADGAGSEVLPLITDSPRGHSPRRGGRRGGASRRHRRPSAGSDESPDAGDSPTRHQRPQQGAGDGSSSAHNDSGTNAAAAGRGGAGSAGVRVGNARSHHPFGHHHHHGVRVSANFGRGGAGQTEGAEATAAAAGASPPSRRRGGGGSGGTAAAAGARMPLAKRSLLAAARRMAGGGGGSRARAGGAAGGGGSSDSDSDADAARGEHAAAAAALAAAERADSFGSQASSTASMSPGGTTGGGGGNDEEEDMCPVCLEDKPNLLVQACSHPICMDCARDLVKRHCLTPALCPYCRGVIKGFKARVLAQQAAEAAARQQRRAARREKAAAAAAAAAAAKAKAKPGGQGQRQGNATKPPLSAQQQQQQGAVGVVVVAAGPDATGAAVAAAVAAVAGTPAVEAPMALPGAVEDAPPKEQQPAPVAAPQPLPPQAEQPQQPATQQPQPTRLPSLRQGSSAAALPPLAPSGCGAVRAAAAAAVAVAVVVE